MSFVDQNVARLTATHRSITPSQEKTLTATSPPSTKPNLTQSQGSPNLSSRSDQTYANTLKQLQAGSNDYDAQLGNGWSGFWWSGVKREANEFMESWKHPIDNYVRPIAEYMEEHDVMRANAGYALFGQGEHLQTQQMTARMLSKQEGFNRYFGELWNGRTSKDPNERAYTFGRMSFFGAEAAVGGLTARSVKMVASGSSAYKPGFYRLSPNEVRFSQSDVSPHFSDGSRVGDLASSLRSGAVSSEDVPTIQVVFYKGKLFTLDNRRLLAFNLANISEIPVEVVSMSDMSVSARFKNRWDPIRGQGNYVAVATVKERPMTQQLLYENGLIKGVQLGK